MRFAFPALTSTLPLPHRFTCHIDREGGLPDLNKDGA
jgi:hypothetical protein